jgi:hypothetical protein
MHWKAKEAKELGLLVVTGLVVAFVRHGVERHWKPWSSWEQFFGYWFIRSLVVLLPITPAARTASASVTQFNPSPNRLNSVGFCYAIQSDESDLQRL